MSSIMGTGTTSSSAETAAEISMDAWTADDERMSLWWANRYAWALKRDSSLDRLDLDQAARMGMLTAKRKWIQHQTASDGPRTGHRDPDAGAGHGSDDHDPGASADAGGVSGGCQKVSWSTFSAYYVRNELRHLVGIRSGQPLPPFVSSLDAPLSEDDDTCLGDMIPDNGPSVEDQVGDPAALDFLLAAVNRMCDDAARDAIMLLYVEGLSYAAAAAAMGTDQKTLRRIKDRGLAAIRKDRHFMNVLRLDADTRWIVPSGLRKFRETGMSSVEAIAEQRERVREAALHRKRVNTPGHKENPRNGHTGTENA